MNKTGLVKGRGSMTLKLSLVPRLPGERPAAAFSVRRVSLRARLC